GLWQNMSSAMPSQAAWLAATKLAAPARRRDALLRRRLLDAVGKSLTDSRVTLISAPAGAGKATLLSALPHAFPETVWAWLLLDSEDNDPSGFAAALVAGLNEAGLSVDEQENAPSDARAIVKAIINWIGQTKERTVAIVLDDLHVISERA